jgi:7-carboxy-7-deazaguanine synthase
MKVSEIFLSIEGEGIRTGAPAVFVRLFGCNLRCAYCDSLYAIQGSDFTEMTPEEIFEKVQSFRTKYVTLTGGEPLIHADVQTLLKLLDDAGFEVNIETNGTRPRPVGYKNVFCTMDWKIPSSGMRKQENLQNLFTLEARDVLKFVVGTPEDLKDAAHIVETLERKFAKEKRPLPVFYVSPIFGTMPYAEMVNWILANEALRRNSARFQVQLHKIIWDPSARGV